MGPFAELGTILSLDGAHWLPCLQAAVVAIFASPIVVRHWLRPSCRGCGRSFRMGQLVEVVAMLLTTLSAAICVFSVSTYALAYAVPMAAVALVGGALFAARTLLPGARLSARPR